MVNARIWTGDPADPWKSAMTVRDGKIVAMSADEPAGRVVDAGGRLVTPGFWEGHCHPQVPFILMSPGSPQLFKKKSVEEVLQTLADYVRDSPEDRYPRLFGWMSYEGRAHARRSGGFAVGGGCEVPPALRPSTQA